MDLAALKAGISDIAVTYKTTTFSVGYRPEAVTEEDLETLEAFGSQSGVGLLRATVEPLKRLLVRWDLTIGPNPLPISADTIATLPPRMRVDILQAIMADFFQPGNARPSDASSPAAASSEGPVPSTPAASSTPNGLALLPGSSPESLTRVAP